jgi:hypothetical protein
MVDSAPIALAVQIMLVGAFGLFATLIVMRRSGEALLFATSRRQLGGFLFCLGMLLWEAWWLLRWALMNAGKPEASHLFVTHIEFGFLGPTLSAVGLTIYLSEMIRPVFKQAAVATAALVILGPLFAGVVLGL